MYNWISYAANTTTTTAGGTAWAAGYTVYQMPPVYTAYDTFRDLWNIYDNKKECEPEIDRDELLEFINS